MEKPSPLLVRWEFVRQYHTCGTGLENGASWLGREGGTEVTSMARTVHCGGHKPYAWTWQSELRCPRSYDTYQTMETARATECDVSSCYRHCMVNHIGLNTKIIKAHFTCFF